MTAEYDRFKGLFTVLVEDDGYTEFVIDATQISVQSVDGLALELVNSCGCYDRGYIEYMLGWLDAADEKRKDIDTNHGYAAMTILDDLGYIEHGSSVRYPWLTARGKLAREFLRWYVDRPDQEEKPEC